MTVVVGARICLWIVDDDLRAWVLEELLLMTWLSPPQLVTVHDLAAIDPTKVGVLVVDVDHMAPHDLEVLRSWTCPIIAIGPDPGIADAHVLPPGLTSRELKQAIRSTAFARPGPRDSAMLR